MATSTVAGIHVNSSTRQAAARAIAPESRRNRPHRRRLSEKAKDALVMLGHASEYLIDDYIYEGGQFNIAEPRLQAGLLMISKSREIYFSCPEIPTHGERIRKWFGISQAA